MIKLIKRPDGFTLIELIAVFVLLSILSAVAVGKVGNRHTDLVAMEAGLTQHIRYVQSKAMINAAEVWALQLDTGSHEYWMVRGDMGQAMPWGGNRIQPLGAEGSQVGYNHDRIQTQRVHVNLGPVSGVGGSPSRLTLLFDEMGRPHWASGGVGAALALPLADTPAVQRLNTTLSIGLSDDDGGSRTISIEPETGFIP